MEKLTGAIVVGVEHLDSSDTLTPESRAALKCAHRITSGDVIAASWVSTPDLEGLGQCGVHRVFVPESGATWPNDSAVHADFVKRVVGEVSAEAVLFSASSLATEVAARLAMKLGSTVVGGVSDFEIVDGGIVASKRVLGGEWEARTAVTATIPVFTVAMKDDGQMTSGTAPALVETLKTEQTSSSVQVVSSESQGSDGALSSADVAVIGGRGVDGDFDLVSRFAQALGGSVGATRVACDEGWADRSLQVGQTGLSISPKLYVGLGVSGAIHHTCGIQGAETIVAVCDDPDAPIFEIADFGVVGNVEDVVPQALEKLAELQNR